MSDPGMPMITLLVSTDVRASVCVVSNTGARPQAWFGYDPFGHALAEQGAREHELPARLTRRYTGQRFEGECGIYDYRARLYDVALARFVAADSAHQATSPYAYCANDPVDHVDVDGAMFELIIYFPGERKFRGYLEGSGEFVHVELPEDPPVHATTYRPNIEHQSAPPSLGRGNTDRSYAEWKVLRIYSLLAGLDVDTRFDEARKSSSRWRRRQWQEAVRQLKRSPKLINYDDLPEEIKALAREPLRDPGPVEILLPLNRPRTTLEGTQAPAIRMEQARSADGRLRRSPPARLAVAHERVVGPKMFRRALKTLYRYRPYQTEDALRIVDRVASRVLLPTQDPPQPERTDEPQGAIASNTTTITQTTTTQRSPHDSPHEIEEISDEL